MAKIKSAAAIAAKWARVVPTRQSDFEDGIKDPDVDWAAGAAAAGGVYAEGVQAAIADDRFAKGVRSAGNEKWKRKVLDVGVQRWAPGVRAAQGDFEAGFGKFVTVIESTLAKLPPRGPRGAPGNNERQAIMSRALHEARVGR